MIKSSIYLVCLILSIASAQCQMLDLLGKNMNDVEKHINKSGGNFERGMTESGNIFYADVDYDGAVAWYFNENKICVQVTVRTVSRKGQNAIIDFKLLVMENGDKFEDYYFYRGKYWDFKSDGDSYLMTVFITDDL